MVTLDNFFLPAILQLTNAESTQGMHNNHPLNADEMLIPFMWRFEYAGFNVYPIVFKETTAAGMEALSEPQMEMRAGGECVQPGCRPRHNSPHT